MTCLDSTSKSLTIELIGTPTTQAQWTVHFATRSGGNFTEGSSDGVTSSITPVTIVSAPSSGDLISIKDITVYNADASSITFVVKLVNGANSRILYRQTLNSLEPWSSLAQKGKDGVAGSTGSVSGASGFIFNESSAPSTATNEAALWVPSSDNLLRFRGESGGTERRIALIDTTGIADNALFYYQSGLLKVIDPPTTTGQFLGWDGSVIQWATPSGGGGGSTDPYAANVVLFLKAIGANNSTTFTDSSTNTKTVTGVGNAKISTTQSKYNGSSIYLDGTGDYLSINTSTDFNLGSDNWTIEFWYYPIGKSDYSAIFCLDGGDYPLSIYHNNTSNSSNPFANVGTNSAWFAANISFSSVTSNTWNHLVLQRNGSSFQSFKNGILISTVTASGAVGSPSTNAFIGTNGVGQAINAYLSHFRITNGVARYTTTFDPETDTYLNL